MNNDYSFENFQRRRDEIKNKKKNEPKSLVRLFVTTFAAVLFSFLVIAAIISPNLNIPALNDDTESVKDMSSSDFKSRVDYRLNAIEQDDTSPKQAMLQQGTNTQLQDAMTTANNLVKVDLPTFNTPQLPSKNSNNGPMTPNFANSTQRQASQGQYPNQQIQQNPQQKLKSTATSQQTPAPYVPKTTQTNKNYKILVGDYSSPEDAQKVADMFAASSNSSAKPMIKSNNGVYSVQVGVYGDAQKAQNIAGAYKAKNYKVKVLEN